VEAIAALVHEDAKLTMPPTPIWLAGRPSIARFLGGILASVGPVRAMPIEASGLPAMAAYARAPGQSTFSASGIHVLACDAHGAARIDAFLDPSLFRRFGLPETI
jgi:RNA polymerase sigma-70 factor (ECF subfamily)